MVVIQWLSDYDLLYLISVHYIECYVTFSFRESCWPGPTGLRAWTSILRSPGCWLVCTMAMSMCGTMSLRHWSSLLKLQKYQVNNLVSPTRPFTYSTQKGLVTQTYPFHNAGEILFPVHFGVTCKMGAYV